MASVKRKQKTKNILYELPHDIKTDIKVSPHVRFCLFQDIVSLILSAIGKHVGVLNMNITIKEGT